MRDYLMQTTEDLSVGGSSLGCLYSYSLIVLSSHLKKLSYFAYLSFDILG